MAVIDVTAAAADAATTDRQDDKARDHCGLFAVYGHPEAVHLTYSGLFALQHRGQERAGMAAWGPGDAAFAILGGQGLVADAFAGDDLADLAMAPRGARTQVLGHVQQSTPGPWEQQPLIADCRGSHLALALNGGLVAADQLRQRLEADGAVFRSGAAVEILAHLAARSAGATWPDAISQSLARIQGGCAIVYATPQGLFGCRDPLGIRPLLLGNLDGAYILASESCALDAVGAELVQEIGPGQWVWIDEHGLQWGSWPGAAAAESSFCIFELIYFARADSRFGGRSIYTIRKELGRRLAQEHTVAADVVLGVPDSSLPAAMGYSAATGIPFELGLIKNRYLGRTFIRPRERLVPAGLRLRLNPIREVVAGRRVVLVDDSLVRGSTARPLVAAVRQAGAREVHLCITSPPFRHPCPFGVNISERGELIAAGRDEDEIQRLVGTDSLQFLSLAGMLAVTGQGRQSYCHGCFTGEYPAVAAAGAQVGAASLAGSRRGEDQANGKS